MRVLLVHPSTLMYSRSSCGWSLWDWNAWPVRYELPVPKHQNLSVVDHRQLYIHTRGHASKTT